MECTYFDLRGFTAPSESDFKVIELHWQLDTLIVPIFRFESDFKVIYLKIGSWIYKVCPVFPKRI